MKYTKKKNVSLNLIDDNSTKDEITNPHDSTARGRLQCVGIYTNGRNIHSISPPGTGHKSLGTRQSSSSVTGHQAPVIEW